MRMPQILSLALLCCLVGSLTAHAGDRLASKRAMSFLQMGAGPRAYAMGEAFSGVGDDLNTLSWNPAGLGFLSDTELLFMHNQWLANLRQEYFSLGYPLPWGYPALQLSYLNSDIQLRRDEDGLLLGNGFNPYSASASLGYGYRLYQDFSLGLLLTYAREQLDDVLYSTVCVDLGGLYRPRDSWWSVGTAVQNAGLPVAGYPLPLTARLGLSGHWFQESLLATLELARTLPGNFRFGIGAEYWYQNLFALRVGYLFRPEREGLDLWSGLRAGLGFNLQGYQLDYAFIPQGDLGLGHRASFTCFFGGGRALVSEKAALINDARQLGVQALRENNFSAAVNHFQKVLTFVPADKTAGEGLAFAQTALKREEQEREIDNRFIKADNYRKAGQLKDAIEEYQRILLIDEKNIRAINSLEETQDAFNAKALSRFQIQGRKALAVRDWADALLAWQSVMELDPSNTEAKQMLEKIRAEMAKGGQGFKDPRIKEFYLSGLHKFEKGNYKGAMEDWSRLLKLEPKHKEAKQYMMLAGKLLEEKVEDLLAAGTRYLQANDFIRTSASWRRIIAISPQHPEATRLIKQNEPAFREKARELYVKGIEQYTLGAFKPAIVNWKDTLILIPDYPGALDNIDKAQKKIKATQ